MNICTPLSTSEVSDCHLMQIVYVGSTSVSGALACCSRQPRNLMGGLHSSHCDSGLCFSLVWLPCMWQLAGKGLCE